jgi:putative tryptophan/tyrosine transport system substrate-binding protein
LNLELVPVEVRGPDDFERAVRAMLEKGANALYVLGTGIFLEHSQQLVDLTVKVRVPAMFYRREFVKAGGLMSYAARVHDMYRRAAAYVDKILKGAKPGDLPVEPDKVRAGNQPEGRQGAGPVATVHIARPRRRGHRVKPAAACRTR